MKLGRANCANLVVERDLANVDMKKPNVRGPSPARKAHLALRDKLNRKSKPAPAWPNRGESGKKPKGLSLSKSVYGKA
jgi:hypothetical protein